MSLARFMRGRGFLFVLCFGKGVVMSKKMIRELPVNDKPKRTTLVILSKQLIGQLLENENTVKYGSSEDVQVLRSFIENKSNLGATIKACHRIRAAIVEGMGPKP